MKFSRTLTTLGLASALVIAGAQLAGAHEPGGPGNEGDYGGHPCPYMQNDQMGYDHRGYDHMGHDHMGYERMGYPMAYGPGMMGYPMAYGPGMMGYGMGYGMGPGMMGPGMMAYGMGYGYPPGYGPAPMHPGEGPGPGPRTPGTGPAYGPGPREPGYGMGPMYRGDGYGPNMGGMMNYGTAPAEMQALPHALTPDQVRTMFEHQLAWGGNPNLKVGDVKQANKDTITADIVTKDGSLVRRFAVDSHTGATEPVQ